MGIVQSTPRRNSGRRHRNPSFSLLFLRFIHKCVKFLWLKLFRFIPFFLSSQQHPILPIQNPPTIIISQPGNANHDSLEHPDQVVDLTSATATQENGPGETIIKVNPPEEKKLVVIKKAVVVDEGRWIKHYSSCHRILLVGEGDFSFSACLATAFGCASNMIATSLDSKEFLKKNYGKAMSNIQKLNSRKCNVLHDINATKMTQYKMLEHITFDRIIFNFPFAGFFKDLPRDSQLRRHRRLVSLFLKNAKGMISENGEVHISHKTNEFHMEWNVEGIASSHGLRLIEAVEFDLDEFPGYCTKRGFGGDDDFNCNPSKTYKFGLKRVHR